jgi:hypothetical protein
VKHSLVVGGSTAGRLINCPASVSLIATMPDAVDVPSEYATEGTALHHIIAELITMPDKAVGDYFNTTITVPKEGDVLITDALIADCIEPALAFYDDNLALTIDADDPILVEQRVQFPGIDGAFGTMDLIALDSAGRRTFLVDWKFGAGVSVKALYPDPDDPDYEIINPQLLYYACAARHSLPQMFPKGGDIVLTIVQPRAQNENERVTQTTVTHDDLDFFERDLRAAIAMAKGEKPPMKKGDWCRFAPCRTICPIWLGPLLDLNEIFPPEKAMPRPATPAVLGDILDLATLIEPIINEARRQAHELLESGGTIEGWKLVPKRATRSWATDDKTIFRAFRKLKIKKDQLITYAVKSPAQAEKLLPKGAKIPTGLVASASSGTTLARSTDPRPDATPIGATIAEIVGALDQLEAP